MTEPPFENESTGTGAEVTPSLPLEAPPSRKRSFAWLAWIIIIATVLFLAFGRSATEVKESAKAQEDHGGELVMKLQARYLVGAEDLLHSKGFFDSAANFRRGDVDARLRFVVLAGELAAPKQAIEELSRLDKDMAQHGVKPTKEQVRARDILRRLYRDYEKGRLDGPSVTQAERRFLQDRLEWFGTLALAPAPTENGPQPKAQPGPALRDAALAPARRTFGVFIGGVAAAVFLGFAGLVGAVVFVVLALSGRLRGGIKTGTGRGGIYAETFAVWLLLFLGLSLAAHLLDLSMPFLLRAGIANLLSLLALGWPVLRGLPWREVRQDVGLTFGRNPLIEPAAGLACYVMALPLVAAGFAVTLVLVLIQQVSAGAESNPFAPVNYPSHPVFGPLAQGGTEDLLIVLFLASVVAPVVEETMFRGVLYRHLREATARFGFVLSFLTSAVVASFVFAVVHPQGPLALPPLMALAFGFTVAREWRGTVFPGMVAHGLHNGLITLAISFMLAD